MIQKNYEWKYAHEGRVCLNCGTVLISYHHHNYKVCSCEQKTMVDGGQIDYIRFGGMRLDLVQEVLVIPVFRTKAGAKSKRRVKTYREVYGKK